MEDVRQDFVKFQTNLKKRNLIEGIAALIVIASFLSSGVDEEVLLRKVAYFEIALAGAFIFTYLFFVKSKKIFVEKLNSEQVLVSTYKEVLREQIKLLSSVRYWYVLPIFIGLFALNIHDIYIAIKSNSALGVAVFNLSLSIGLSLFIIWLNEVKTVAELKSKLNSLESVTL